jgi:hypothetical protein
VKKATGLLTGLMALFVVLVGCDKKDQAQLNKALSTVQVGAEQGADAVKNMVTDSKDDYQKSAQTKLDQLSASIDDLKQKAETADAQAQGGLHQAVRDLQKQRDDLQAKLDALKNSTTDAWKDMTGGINQSLGDLQKACDRAASQFKAPAK